VIHNEQLYKKISYHGQLQTVLRFWVIKTTAWKKVFN